MTFVCTNIKHTTFVSTNKTSTNMKIEEELKSTVDYNKSTRVVLNVMYTQNVITDSFNEIVKVYDISGEQYNVLRILRGQKGHPANMCVIQERMLAKTSNTTRLVDKLLLKEYVTRNVCPDNRRKIEVLITQKGLDLLIELDPKVKEHEDFFAKNLNNEELEQLNTLLEKYRTK
ncbi:MarR Transcriptional regulators [Flavobacteriaceae bacterium]